MQVPRVDRDHVVNLTRDLIRFKTVNPPGNEQPVAEFLQGMLVDLGFEVELQPVGPNRANLIARLPGRSSGHLVFTGHVDVVAPGELPWNHGPFDAEVEDGRVYGRGSVDMKGGVAAMVSAAVALARAGFKPEADLILAVTCGEETGLIGARTMAEQRSLEGSRWLVVTEPSDLNVFIAHKGILWVDVRAYGRTAHGSMPSLGVNAVSYMARLIARLEEYPFSYEESPLLGNPTLSVNVIQGGNKTNVVPDFSTVSIDMRTVPSQRHETIVEDLRRVADEVARDFGPELRVEVETINNAEGVETPSGDHLIEEMVQAITDVRGQRPTVGGVVYTTDASVLKPAFDLPTVICGPGTPGMAHQPDEWVAIDQLDQAAQIYASLAVRLLA